MTEKIAYFVLGSEGSGTHMLCNALIEAGCDWKQEHESDDNPYKFWEMSSPFVFRRSLPHAHKWSDIVGIANYMKESRFNVHTLFIIRDFNATVKSITNQDSKRFCAERNQRGMIMELGDFLFRFFPAKFTHITYEGFCLSEGFRRWLFNDRLGLPYPENFEIKYANEKYYNNIKESK